MQTYVAAFCNCADFDGCGDSSPEKKPQWELEELEQSLSESAASEVVDRGELMLEKRFVVIGAQCRTVVDYFSILTWYGTVDLAGKNYLNCFTVLQFSKQSGKAKCLP